ncbi:MAG: hypothetical protein IKH50_12145 [Oscillospiraceae bacterium]|nr:hypothetical protein [Oscillospiraceae bacterium]
MANKELMKEIRFAVICSLCLDIILVAVASAFTPFIGALTGALFGTLLLACDLFFISLTVHSVVRGAVGGKNGTAVMISQYILRLLFLGAGLFAAVEIPFMNFICAAVPLLYPKIIFPLKAIFEKKEG